MTKITPYSWQLNDVTTLRDNNYTGLLNIEPGGTKTMISLLAAKDSGAESILIIAPDPTFATAWIPTVKRVLGAEARIIGGTGKAKKQALFDFEIGYPGVYLSTPQLLTRSDVSSWTGDMCIVDEGHMLNKMGGKGQKKLAELAHNFPMRLFLSGTAWRNNFDRAWATMRFLHPELFKRGEVSHDNAFVWKMDRMTSEDVVIGFEWKKCSYDDYKNPPEGHYRKMIDGNPHLGAPKIAKKWLNEEDPGLLISQMPCVITHKKREKCCEFHPKGFLDLEEPQVIEHVIDLHPKQKKAIKELEAQYLTWLNDNPLITELTITQQQRIRQICLGVPTVEYVLDEDNEEKQVVTFDPNCASPFAEELIRLLDELDDESAVVYLESQSFAEVLTGKLKKAGVTAFEYSGKTRKTRDEDLAKFGTQYRVAVVVLSAGGTGLDGIQKATKNEVWLERSVDETVNIQGESRADRIGGIGQVQRHIFHDSEMYSLGRMSAQLERRFTLAKSLRKA